MDFEGKSLEQLQEDHSQMLATAGDLGMDVTEEQGAVEFDSVEDGVAACTALHEAITAFRAGLDEDNKTVASDDKKVQGEAGSQAKKKSAKKKVTSNKPKADPPAKSQEKTVAKKATAKKAKAPAKKAAPKKANGGGTPRSSFADDAIITVKAKENPFRGGRKDRFDKLMKFSGKTVKAYLAAGGVPQTLSNAVKDGNATVK